MLLASALASGVTHHLTLPAGQAVSVIGGPFPRLELPRPAPPRPAPVPDFTFPPDWTLRHRLGGDRIRLGGGERKVSDVLSDLRLPRAERDGVWLLAAPGGVQWLGTQPPIWALGARAQVGPAAGPEQPRSGAEADHHFMGEALALAGAAAQRGEVPVGALVVCGGAVVVASAANRSRELGDMTRHAELDALRQAARVVGPYLSGCTLYVTLEPCPMCLGAAIEARLGRLVYGASQSACRSARRRQRPARARLGPFTERHAGRAGRPGRPAAQVGVRRISRRRHPEGVAGGSSGN